MQPDFGKAIQDHFDAIANRDIEAFKAHLTCGDKLYTIVQNGHAFTFIRWLVKTWQWRWSNTSIEPKQMTSHSALTADDGQAVMVIIGRSYD